MGKKLFSFEDQKRFYDKNYEGPIYAEDEKYYQWIAGLLGRFANGGKLLDVACGNGYFLKEAEGSFETYGNDISEIAVKNSKKICKNTKFKVSPAEKMSYPKNYFDIITCLGSLEHFVEPEKSVRRISQILKKNGIAVIVLPNSWYALDFIYRGLIRGESQTHGQQLERFYSKMDGKKLLEDNGLKVVKMKKYNPHIAPLVRGFKFRPLQIAVQTIWSFFVRPLIPLNVCYQICYICEKK